MTNSAVPAGVSSTCRGGAGRAACAPDGLGAISSCITWKWYAGEGYETQALLADQAQRGPPPRWQSAVGPGVPAATTLGVGLRGRAPGDAHIHNRGGTP